MTQVILSMSMSLDGYAAGPNVGVEFPMGEGGLRLHEWLLSPDQTEADAAVGREMHARTGAVILGRRTFDVGVDLWEDTPYAAPCFVLTHDKLPVRTEKSGTFTFVNDGIESALKQARAHAGGKDVMLMGVNVAQQFIRAGLVDEIQISLVPVLLCGGVRLFDQICDAPIALKQKRILHTPAATHLWFQVIKKSSTSD